MRHTVRWIGLGAVGIVALPFLPGLFSQESIEGPPPAKIKSPASPASKPAKGHDVSRLSLLQRHLYLSAQRGANWMMRANRADGRFIHGCMPALRQLLEGDHYLRQAAAAGALARAGRFLGDDGAAAIARQALLTLLLETAADPKNTELRSTTAPPPLVNPEAAAGLLIAAIHELPDPGKDLLDQADQLCNFLRSRLRPDGSIAIDTGAPLQDSSANAPEKTFDGLDQENAQYFSGPALFGIVKSLERGPAPPLPPLNKGGSEQLPPLEKGGTGGWKLQAVVKGCAFYSPLWRQHRNSAMVAYHTAAYAEAFLRSKDKILADAVFEMNDWLCTLQYQQQDPRRSNWSGGFMTWVDGKPIAMAPDIQSAALAESLAEACRVAHAMGDVTRHQRYRRALESALQFITTLQYTDANVQHFADWYRPVLVGAFHASPRDGNVRLDYTQQAVAALVQYLQHAADLP